MLREDRLGEPWHGLRARHVRPTHEPAERPIAVVIESEQEEVGASLRLADAAQVLLHERAMTGQPGPDGAWAERPAIVGPGLVLGRRLRAATARPDRSPERRTLLRLLEQRPPARRHGTTSRHDHSVGIGHERIDQLDLQPDDRPQPDLERGVREPDHAVQALVVRDRRAR